MAPIKSAQIDVGRNPALDLSANIGRISVWPAGRAFPARRDDLPEHALKRLVGFVDAKLPTDYLEPLELLQISLFWRALLLCGCFCHSASVISYPVKNLP